LRFSVLREKIKRMRILLLCNKSPWPPRDGGAFATLNLIRCLSESDVHTTVIALNPDKHHVDKGNIPEEIKRLADLILIDTNTDINLFRIAFNLLFSKKPYNITRFWSVDYRNELLKLRLNDFNLIQIEGLAMHQYLQIIRKFTNVPVIFRPHNVENLIWQGLCEEESNIFKRIYFRILASRLRETEKVIANDFDGVIAFSSTDLTWFNEKGLVKPSLILTPCFSEFDIHTSDNIQDKSICYIGALDWLPNIKGLSWFIESVWPLVLKGEPEARFHIAGRNASRKTIRKIQGRNIFYEGEVANSEQFLRNKAIMVVPLFSGSGVRIKILEGMLMGKCIVATTVAASGIDYLNGENIFIADNASAFAERIVKLLNDDNLRISTANNAIGYVRKNYNILATSQRLIKFYQKLLA
jgi:polysaccharide biosynthesis protein PslH